MSDLKCYRCGQWPCECADGQTIVHGDCREVLPQLDDCSIDFVFMDPPYGHNNNDGDLIHNREKALGEAGPIGEARPIANDGEEADPLVRFCFSEINRLLGPGCCCCCCCCGGGPDPQFARWSLWLDEAIGFKQVVVWDKGPMGMGWHYRRSYEVVLVAEKPGGKCRWFGGNTVENIIRPSHGWAPKILPRQTDHPTPKPPGLAEFFINLHSEPGDLVLDPFLGGGSTMRACKNVGRRCLGIELEERYCEMAANRLRQAVLF